MNEEKKLNDEALEKAAGGMPSIEEIQKFDEAVTKTCGGCDKQVDTCPYHRDPEIVTLTFNGGRCPFNPKG